MDVERLAPTVGIVGALCLGVSVALPGIVVASGGGPTASYYASGPTGLSIIGLLALLAVIVFLSGLQGRTDAETSAGLALVLSLAMLGLTTLWAFSIDSTVLFSFEREYSWLEYHRWAVLGSALLTFVGAAGYARSVL
ncbi:hypothetical protein ACFQJC_11295 [Haloferax namakaokahaiae]|uniref:Uncharacterized protein n=1 Tax=Haloferax namakaokahaiae TaxID=1748331 RepID=A0ABD5ZGK6_9EURY